MMRRLTAITAMLCIFSLMTVANCFAESFSFRTIIAMKEQLVAPAEVAPIIAIDKIKTKIPIIQFENLAQGIKPEKEERCNSPG